MHSVAQVWIGLATVKPYNTQDNILDSPHGAFVNVLAWASDAPAFVEAVSGGLHVLGLYLVDMEDVEPYADRLAAFKLRAAIRGLAKEVTASKGVRFDLFHAWSSDEALPDQ